MTNKYNKGDRVRRVKTDNHIDKVGEEFSIINPPFKTCDLYTLLRNNKLIKVSKDRLESTLYELIK